MATSQFFVGFLKKPHSKYQFFCFESHRYSNLQTTKISFHYYQTVHVDKTNKEQWLPAVNDMINIGPLLWKPWRGLTSCWKQFWKSLRYNHLPHKHFGNCKQFNFRFIISNQSHAYLLKLGQNQNSSSIVQVPKEKGKISGKNLAVLFSTSLTVYVLYVH